MTSVVSAASDGYPIALFAGLSDDAVSDELAAELRRLAARRDPEPSIAALIEELLALHVMLEERLGGREFRMPTKPLQITSVDVEDGPTDVSINHDAYFVDDEVASWQRDEPSGEPTHE